MFIKSFILVFLLVNISYASECGIELEDDINITSSKTFDISNIGRYREKFCDEVYKGCLDSKKILKTASDRIDALIQLQELAENGNVFAQILAGLLHFNGKTRNLPDAEKYWLMAAKQNHPRAHYALGVLYYLKNKKEKSAKYFKLSSDLGYKNAHLITALNYYHGRYGLEKDEDKFFILAYQSLGSNIIQHTEIKWPYPCNKDIPITMNIEEVLGYMIGNEGWYADLDRQKRIRKLLLAYDDNQFKDTLNSNYFEHSVINGIPTMSTEILIKASSALKSEIGMQKFSNKLGNQPTGRDGDTLESMYSAIGNKNTHKIYSSKFKDPSDSSSTVLSTEKFWNVISPSDWVLLTDGITHHWTLIFKIDRDNNSLYFADRWPDEFFLLKNKNDADISAEKVNYKHGNYLLKVQKNDFFKVAVGIVGHRAIEE